MRFFKLSPDEIIVTDGKTSVLIMARDGKLPPEAHIELEGIFSTYVCGTDCPKAGTIFWQHCDDCPKEVQPS